MKVKLRARGSGRWKTFVAHAAVKRRGVTSTRGKEFYACISLSGKRAQSWGWPRSDSGGCGDGRNPRQALARAARGLARNIQRRRSGAFKGTHKRRRR